MLALAIAIACASTIDLPRLDALPEGEGIVFGRVEVRVGGKPQRIGGMFPEGRVQLALRQCQSQSDSDALAVRIGGDGSFVWHLPPGRHDVVAFLWSTRTHAMGSFRAHFDVEPDRARYVGTLAIDIVGSHFRVAALDEYASASGRFRGDFPGVEVARAVISIEDPAGGSLSTGSRESLMVLPVFH